MVRVTNSRSSFAQIVGLIPFASLKVKVQEQLFINLHSLTLEIQQMPYDADFLLEKGYLPTEMTMRFIQKRTNSHK